MPYIPKKINESGSDALFITEIMNDLHKNGFTPYGKADTMLRDWKWTLEGAANFSKTNQRKVHAAHCGQENW